MEPGKTWRGKTGKGRGTRAMASAILWASLKNSKPFFMMAGPNVLRNKEHALRVAEGVASVKQATGIEVVFKVGR